MFCYAFYQIQYTVSLETQYCNNNLLLVKLIQHKHTTKSIETNDVDGVLSPFIVFQAYSWDESKLNVDVVERVKSILSPIQDRRSWLKKSEYARLYKIISELVNWSYLNSLFY